MVNCYGAIYKGELLWCRMLKGGRFTIIIYIHRQTNNCHGSHIWWLRRSYPSGRLKKVLQIVACHILSKLLDEFLTIDKFSKVFDLEYITCFYPTVEYHIPLVDIY